MTIREYYEGFSDKQVEEYRADARRKWGEDVVAESEERVTAMGKEKFTALQAEGDAIFKAISESMASGYRSKKVQVLVGRWRQWLENFSHYSDEAAKELGHVYSEDARFVELFRKYHPDLPEFMTKAIDYYLSHKS